MKEYTSEKDCETSAKLEYYMTHSPQLVFKKKRKYIHTSGSLNQESKETFINPFGEERHYSEVSDIRKKYQNDGYELRGWVNNSGCFKFN